MLVTEPEKSEMTFTVHVLSDDLFSASLLHFDIAIILEPPNEHVSVKISQLLFYPHLF